MTIESDAVVIPIPTQFPITILSSPVLTFLPAHCPNKILFSPSPVILHPAHTPSETKLVVSTNFRQPPPPALIQVNCDPSP